MKAGLGHREFNFPCFATQPKKNTTGLAPCHILQKEKENSLGTRTIIPPFSFTGIY